jgi:short-subunit dehydrogenase
MSKRWEGQIVVITGAASGLGRLMAIESFVRGAHKVVALDIDSNGLDALKEEVEKRFDKPVNLLPFKVDLSSTASIEQVTKELAESVTRVDILFNNAGVVVGKNFSDHKLEDVQLTLNVNVLGPMWLAHQLLPLLKNSQEAHIINIASAAALVSNPKMSVYCASKWALVGWSDSLRLELAEGPKPARVTTVLPYYINTGMFDGVKSPIIPILNPEDVVRRIFKAVEQKRIFLYLPKILYVVPLLYAILPTRAFDFIVGKIFGIYKSMNEFKGRTN